MRNVVLSGLFLVLTGCAVVPAKEYKFDKSRVYSQSYDVVWKKLTKYYAGNSISIETIEKASGIIAAKTGRVSDEYVSCSSIPGALPPVAVAKLNTFVEKEGASVKVTVNTVYSGTIANIYGAPITNSLPCNSTGKLEKEILDYIN